MKTINVGLGGYSVMQAPNMTDTQMMSYIIRTPAGKVMVIDGGNPGDANYLRDTILSYGGHVDMWLITHCHDDHYSALISILDDPRGVTVGGVYYNFPPYEWIVTAEPVYKIYTDKIFDCIANHSKLFHTLYEGSILTLDGLQVEVLNDPLDFQEFTEPSPNGGSSVNDTTLVFRIRFPNRKTALFLGDLGLRAGNLLAERYGKELKSDIVQMAHHGQNGADENVYQLIKPEVCLWTAPIWLYNNDRGRGYNTHHYKTVTVRGWMEKLGVEHHAVEGEGPAIVI